jgi:serine protease DegS
MKFIRFINFVFRYSFIGLVVAGAYLLWQSDTHRNTLLGYLKPVENIVKPQPSLNNRHSGPVSYADAVANSAPSVVTIYTSKTVQQAMHPLLKDPLVNQLFGDQLQRYKREKTETNLGSGVIITHTGYILTNQHVINDAEEILVSLADGRSSRARLVGQDRDTDLAVLHIPLDNLVQISVPSNNEPVKVGDVVLAIGNPLNVGQTVTMGIISATGRNRLGINNFENFIQTDAAINPGNSGGALINAHGKLIGINTAIFSRDGGSQGIGFAIPVKLALNVMYAIVTEGRVRRGWLGVEGTEITAQAALASGNPNVRGVLIVGVFVGSPADKAGIETGDILTAIDDQPVIHVRDVLDTIAAHRPGDIMKVTLMREGKEMSLMMVATERPSS